MYANSNFFAVLVLIGPTIRYNAGHNYIHTYSAGADDLAIMHGNTCRFSP